MRYTLRATYSFSSGAFTQKQRQFLQGCSCAGISVYARTMSNVGKIAAPIEDDYRSSVEKLLFPSAAAEMKGNSQPIAGTSFSRCMAKVNLFALS